MSRTTSSLLAASACAIAGLLSTPADAEAQRRVGPRSRTSAVVVVGSPGFYRPAFYHPGFYDPFLRGYYAPFFGWYPQYPPPYGPPRWRYDNSGSARLRVEPKETQVFLDGYFVGTVDDFDGYFQRLHAPPGEHELTFYLDGYRTRREKVLIRPRATLQIEFAMEPLAPGDPQDPRPAPAGAPGAPDEGRRRVTAPPYRPGPDARYGTLALGVQPVDAQVIVDGEPWERPAGEARFTIDLPEGPHRIEVTKEGFRPYARMIQIRGGETLRLNVSLTSGGDAQTSRRPAA